ncbi:hypothetical protein EJ02DRAFT_354090 [Clathrospora elynae]|uniref:RBR-type E3 ubiquitin transferase n=1 Tax=Clathrospora elynae TaxID=706981 RepID=A0A6A5SN32_9PLEO|nr:hypothetical protein EJ02DRAFT_354090 [Clathrospora elynae]
MICTDTLSLGQFPDRRPTTKCKHDGDICRHCLGTWIASEFGTKIWDEIRCPVCPALMEPADMEEFAPSDIYKRWNDVSIRATLESTKNWTWCGLKSCKSGDVHDPRYPKFCCKVCNKAHCITHNVAWHKGETCSEYDYRKNKYLKRAEELATQKLMRDTTKKCPGCKRKVEKSYGCDHMTCTKCKHEFCWQCLAEYVKNRRGRMIVHQPGCVFHNPSFEPEVLIY